MRPYVTEAVTACIQATQYIYYLTRSGWCWAAPRLTMLTILRTTH